MGKVSLLIAGVRNELTPRFDHGQYPARELTVPPWYLRARPPRRPPTIALVTPSRNQAKYVRQAVESVLGQAYPALEYVIQDGGSDDDTVAVLRPYLPRLAHFESVPDSGQAAAINRGFSHTHGEIMGWLNSDDVLLPGSLAYVARIFDSHPEIDMVYGDSLSMDANAGETGVRALPPHRDEALRWITHVPQETAFWRRSLWDRVGGLDEDLHYTLDWDLFLRFQNAGARIVHRPRLLGAFRWHDEQKTASRTAQEDLRREIDVVRSRNNGGLELSDAEASARSDYYQFRSVPRRLKYRLLRLTPLPRAPVRLPP
jgi:glycosyltransferase involved in cell wall biosynthesis